MRGFFMRWHRYKRPALATITTTLIILAAVAALGVSGIVLYQSKIKGVKEDVSSSYTSVANKIQESLIMENAYYHNTTQSMNTTLTNNGNIPVQITNATLTEGPLFESANATVVSAGNGGVLGGVSGSIIPITLTNNQRFASPTTFQQKITFNPSQYTSSEAANLGNIRFCADPNCNTYLDAWLESFSGSSTANTATSATAWVKLTSAIAANGGQQTIYLVFQPTSTNFDTNYWGEAANISSTYGQYDNGANVFTFYDSFVGNSLSGKWTAKSSSGSYSVNNGITFTTTSSSNGYSFVVSATQSSAQVAESYMVSVASGADAVLGVTTSQSHNNGIELYNGYSMDYPGSNIYYTTQTSSSSTNLGSPSEGSFPAGIWTVTWNATGHEYFQDGSGLSNTYTDSSLNLANYGIYIGQSNSATGSNVVDWARMRAVPPNNVMPTVSFGGSSSVVPGSYIPITLTNSQSSATPNPFQQELTFNPSSYSNAEGSDLGNIMFCESVPSNGVCSSEDYAWLENCNTSPCTNLSTSATAWVRLNSQIQGSGGTHTIYLLFQSPITIDFTDNHWGESYQAASNSFSHDNIANVMNSGMLNQIYWDSTSSQCSSSSSTDHNLLYSASLGNAVTINGCSNFISSINPYPTPATGSTQSVYNQGSPSNVIIDYQSNNYHGGSSTWPNPPVTADGHDDNDKAVGWAEATSSTTIDVYPDDGASAAISTTTGGFTTGGANWLGGSSETNIITCSSCSNHASWADQSANYVYQGTVPSGDNRIELDYYNAFSDAEFAVWSSASLNYYSFAYPPTGVMPTTSLGSAQGPSSSYNTLTQSGKCIIYPGQSCTESITYHCFSDPVSVTVTTARGRTFQTNVAPVVPWYSSQWQYRKEISIYPSQVSAALTSFPVLVNVTDSNLQSNAQASGNDIIFTACDGKTPLNYEIEKYTSATGSLVAWVKVPALYDTPNDIIYMYYGNPNANPSYPYVPVTLTNSQPSSSSLSVDGTYTDQFSGTSSNSGSSQSLTTTNANDVIIVSVTNENNGGTLRTVSSIASTGLTFVQRSSKTSDNSVDTEVWYAIASSPLNSASILVTLSGSTDDASIVAFGVSGANTAAPWDTNVALPAVAKSTNNNPSVPSVSGVSTSNANDMILGFEGAGPTQSSPPTAVAGAGFNLIATQKNTGGTNWSQAAAEDNIVSTKQSGISVGLSSSSTYNWVMIGDAIVANTVTPLSTPVPFQQEITFNPSTYAGLEAANLGNIRFCADLACNHPLYSWLETCGASACTNLSTSATVWTTLTNSTNAGGTQRIFMVFQPINTNFDGNYWGEAPQLSGTYGQYDNGANVFSLYFNGNTAISNFNVAAGFTLSQATGISFGSSTINAIKVSGSGSWPGNSWAYKTSISNAANVLEGTVENTQTNNAVATLDLQDGTSPNNAEGTYNWYSGSYFAQTYNSGGSVTQDQNQQGSGVNSWVYYTVQYTGSSASSFYSSIAPQLYSKTGGYSGTVSANPLSSASNIYIGDDWGNQASTPSTYYMNWVRDRVYPPNGVMPTVSFGSIVQVDPWDSTYVAVWHFAQNPSQTTQILDSSGNGDTLTASSQTSITQVGGKIDGSLNFASSSYLSNTSPLAMPSSSPMTLSAWFLASSTSGTQDILKVGNSVKMGYVSPNFQVTTGSGTQIVYVPASSVPSGVWHYAVYTYDGSTSRLYIDGSQVATSSTAPGSVSPNNLYVATKDGTAEYFTGQIDETRISNIARSVDWISTEYKNQAFSSSFYTLQAQQAYSDPRTSH
jgi:hypothetical protein